jgi:hypothetical protein
LVIAFLDASALIYLVEGDALWAAAVKQQLLQLAAKAHASESDIRLAISRLSWLECRVGPSAVMVTGDAGFQRVPGLPVALVQDALPPHRVS